MHKRIFVRALGVALAFTLSIAADDNSRLAAPVGGYLIKGGQVRPVIGNPGAAYLGGSIADISNNSLAVCSSKGIALATSSDRQSVRVLPLTATGAGDATEIAAFDSPVDSIAFSASCNVAAIVRRDKGSIDVLTNLATGPVHRTSWTLPAGASSIAIADDGAAAAVITSVDLQISDSAGARVIASGTGLRGIQFRPNTHDLVYVDGDSVATIANASSKPVRNVVAGSVDALAGALSALFSPDGQFVFIAGASSNELLAVSTSGVASQRISLPCPAVQLEPLSDSAVRLHCEAEDVVRVISVQGSNARVLFIPEPVQ